MRQSGPVRSRWLLAALACVLFTSGCRWLPLLRPEASIDPRALSRPGPGETPRPPEVVLATDPRADGPLPELPRIYPVSDAEALAPSRRIGSTPSPAVTPVTQSQPQGAQPNQAETISDQTQPVPRGHVQTIDPETQPAQLSAPLIAQPENQARIEPQSTVAEGPEDAWQAALENLLSLSRAQAIRERAMGTPGLWSSRNQVLTQLARTDGTSWRIVMDALAAALDESRGAQPKSATAESDPSPPSRPETSPEEKPADPRSDEIVEKPSEVDPQIAISPISALKVAELAFCRRVDGFGVYEPATGPFRPGQSVGIYWEVEGFKSDHDGTWHKTRIDTTLEIAAPGTSEPVWREELGTAEDVCRRLRRDFFINTRLTMPDRLVPGNYVLRLRLKDLVSGQQAARELEFSTHAPK